MRTLAIAAFCIIWGIPGLVEAAERPLALTLAPAAINLDPGPSGSQRLMVVARPAQGRTIRSARLTVLPAPGIRTQVVEQPATNASPVRSELVWVLEVMADPGINGEVVQMLRLDYQTATGAGVTSIEIATLTVKPRALPGVATVVEAAIIKDFASLFEKQSGRAYLRVRNLADTPMTITVVRLFHPNFLTITLADPAPWRVEARGAVVKALDLKIQDNPAEPLQIGNHNVGVVLSLERSAMIQPWTGQATVESTVTIGVPGLSDVQNLVQVPSFLLLPGVLVLATIALMWRLFKPALASSESEPPAFPLSVHNPEFWVVSVTLSIAIVSFYPVVTALLWQPRDVLLGYGLKDVLAVWFGSILFGTLAFLVGAGAWRMWHAIAEWKAAKTQFAKNDDVLSVLQRLHLLNRSPRLPVTKMSDGKRLFNLGADRASADKVWAIPAVRVRANSESDAQFLADLQTVVEKDDPEAIRVKLQKGRYSKSITFEWDSEQYIGPTLVEAAVFDKAQSPQRFIEVE